MPHIAIRPLFVAVCFFFSAVLVAEEPLIDVVYTWVDGSDPEWQSTLVEQLAEAGLPPVISKKRASLWRFCLSRLSQQRRIQTAPQTSNPTRETSKIFEV